LTFDAEFQKSNDATVRRSKRTSPVGAGYSQTNISHRIHPISAVYGFYNGTGFWMRGIPFHPFVVALLIVLAVYSI